MNNYANFSQDPEIFLQAKAFWVSLCDSIVENYKGAGSWDSWFEGIMADGSIDLSGNPIYSLVNRDLERGVRMIQIEPDKDELQLKAWIDVYDKGAPGEITELVIYCQLTDKSEDLAKKLLHEWINTNNLEGFDSFIDDVLGW